MSYIPSGTVMLVTVNDVAKHLSTTGQAVSAWLKNESLSAPAPQFAIKTAYGRRQVELFWHPDQMTDWEDFARDLLVSQQAEIIAKADKARLAAAKAQERAAKAQELADRLVANLESDSDDLDLEV
jgi:hypothetical protein